MWNAAYVRDVRCIYVYVYIVYVCCIYVHIYNADTLYGGTYIQRVLCICIHIVYTCTHPRNVSCIYVYTFKQYFCPKEIRNINI